MLQILNQSLWRDEAFSALLSLKNPLEIISLTIKDTTPPLHYLLLHYWILMFGASEVSLRGLSFLFHLLLVLTVFLISKKLIKSTFAQVIIALTTLLNPFLLQYAFEARPYSLLALLSVLAIYFTISKKYILTGVVLALAVFTHNFAWFTVAAFAFWFIYSNKHRLKDTKIEIMKLFSLPTLALLIWGSVIWQQWTRVALGFWVKQATFSLFLNSFEKYTRGDLSYPTQPMLYTFTLVLCFFAFGYWLWRERKEEHGNALLLISSIALIPTLITYLISALFAPIYHERYLIASVPLLVLLVGYSLYKLYEYNVALRSLLVAFVAIYVVLLFQASEQIIGSSTKPAINYGVDQILSKAGDKDVIIPQSPLNFLETKYYVERSGRNIPVYAYSPDGKIPWYIGSILFDKREIITKIPNDKVTRVWQIKPDGGYDLLK